MIYSPLAESGHLDLLRRAGTLTRGPGSLAPQCT